MCSSRRDGPALKEQSHVTKPIAGGGQHPINVGNAPREAKLNVSLLLCWKCGLNLKILTVCCSFFQCKNLDQRKHEVISHVHGKHASRHEALTRLSVRPPSTRQNFPRLGEEEAVVLSTRHLKRESALITSGVKRTSRNSATSLIKRVRFVVYLDDSTVESVDPVNDVAAAEKQEVKMIICHPRTSASLSPPGEGISSDNVMAGWIRE